jgi:protocatechuate 3,4-dioxygenase beta subunit
MNKRTFLKAAGLAGAGVVMTPRLRALEDTPPTPASCVLIPTETAGPFPLDLTENPFYFRQDVREDRVGMPLFLTLRVLGDKDCQPLQNARVNIWHCDNEGRYSGYSVNMNPGQAGLTYLRGYQITDANGEVRFTTIVPGWYPGRVCHIHFQVFVSSSNAAISQLTFDIPSKQAIYAANPDLYPRGADPTTISGDNIFADGYQYQITTLTPRTGAPGYEASLEVTVRGGTVSSVGHAEKENAKQFTLGQNAPNPFTTETTIPFTLVRASHVALDLFDLHGRQVMTIHNGDLDGGSYAFPVDLRAAGLPTGTYAYRVRVVNGSGIFADTMVMTGMQ